MMFRLRSGLSDRIKDVHGELTAMCLVENKRTVGNRKCIFGMTLCNAEKFFTVRGNNACAYVYVNLVDETSTEVLAMNTGFTADRRNANKVI